MKMFAKTVRVVLDMPYRLAAAPLGLAAMADRVMAQAADVKGALDTNKAGLEAVGESSFTGTGAKEAAQNFTNVLLYGAGAIGIALVILGIYQLWQHQKEGDQARGSATQGIAMVLIGGCMTIPAIITAIAPQILVGAG